MLDVQTKPTFQSIPWHAMRFKEADLFEHDHDLSNDMASGTFEDADELRRPLTKILNALEAFPDGHGGDPATRRARMIVKRQARRAARIIEDLFDVGADPRDISPFRREVLELAEIVTGASETIGGLLDSRRQQLTVLIPTEPVYVVTDPLRMEQHLTILLANASIFTAPGGDIRLTATVETEQVVIRVWVNEPDNNSFQQPRVFTPFLHAQHLRDHWEGKLEIDLAATRSVGKARVS
ncbi:MAG: HAMP domain-containing sensor histidine kinase [Gemmatales bacterium]